MRVCVFKRVFGTHLMLDLEEESWRIPGGLHGVGGYEADPINHTGDPRPRGRGSFRKLLCKDVSVFVCLFNRLVCASQSAGDLRPELKGRMAHPQGHSQGNGRGSGAEPAFPS